MNKQARIQSMIVRHLLDHGTLDILLPDGIVLEIGIVNEVKNGSGRKLDDYCYVSAQRQGRKMLIDSFNMGISFPDRPDSLLFEEYTYDERGEPLRRVDVI